MRRFSTLLAAAVVLRLAAHALYLPAFEGPDEPHHLARVAAFSREPLGRALAGGTVPPDIVAAVRAHPCGPSLAKAYGCPPYSSGPAAFNLLREPPRASAAETAANPEANQPPLFYLLAGLPARAFGWLPRPESLLLYVRLFNVLLVALAIFGPLRTLAAGRPPFLAVVFLLVLLLPGASESLARCSNDASVFLWSALVLAALERGTRGAPMVLLLLAGPMFKLTAIPVVAFAVVNLWQERRRREASAGALAACLVFLVQAARGWRWGGTLELNRPTAAIGEPVGVAALGLARSAYAFLKTTFWLGGWSFFRAPRPLVVLFALLILAWALAVRRRRDPPRALAHAAAALAAAVGFLAFALANRRLYGVWGGVGGWYAWAWWPWIAVAAGDLTTLPSRAVRPLIVATGLFVVAANAFWLTAAERLYGSLAP